MIFAGFGNFYNGYSTTQNGVEISPEIALWIDDNRSVYLIRYEFFFNFNEALDSDLDIYIRPLKRYYRDSMENISEIEIEYYKNLRITKDTIENNLLRDIGPFSILTILEENGVTKWLPWLKFQNITPDDKFPFDGRYTIYLKKL